MMVVCGRLGYYRVGSLHASASSQNHAPPSISPFPAVGDRPPGGRRRDARRTSPEASPGPPPGPRHPPTLAPHGMMKIFLDNVPEV